MDKPSRTLMEEACGHLAPAGVLDTDEKHLGDILRDRPLRLAKRAKTLTRETVHEQGDEVAEARCR